MKISTNPIGNYFPNKIGNVTKSSSIDKTDSSQSKEQSITIREKEFFANLYPEQKSEIMEYHYYQKNGVMSGVTLGSILDRRG
ncbi:MAG: hypothetical protein KAQ90_06335 [Melioribacteraceae bacterium]|nr:hypothetical protein [Melioribacteraceae bacterium]